jgi:signal transduction histidine kinase
VASPDDGVQDTAGSQVGAGRSLIRGFSRGLWDGERIERLVGNLLINAVKYGAPDAPVKLADLVILDKNPLKIDTMAIKDIKVVETFKEGKSIYRAS